MKDRLGRTVDYLRVSITDRCNLRCRYCMPEGIQKVPMEEILTLEESAAVCRIGAENGITRIKVTGGEPLVRRGCPEFVGMVKQIPGIRQVTLTTNGVLLKEYGDALLENGLDAVNISLDTRNREKYRQMTGVDALPQVEEAVEEMLRRSVPVKINAVLEKGCGREDWEALAALAEEKPLQVRFIEMMPLGHGKAWQGASGAEVLAFLESRYGAAREDQETHGNGPAVYWKFPGFTGSVGFINAIHGKFCQNCNRLRLTARGELKPCLAHGGGTSLKEALRRGDEKEAERLFRETVLAKPAGHCFDRPEEITEKRDMGKIGG